MKILKIIIVLFIVFNGFSYIANATLAITPLKFEFKINPGDSKSWKIKITNNYKYPITLYTSTEDFISWDDKWNPKFVKPQDQPYPKLSINNWVKIKEKNITLTPLETREVSFEVKVPKDGEPGWHYWAIFFSPWMPDSAQLAVIQRLWTLILIDVAWDIKIDWDIQTFKIWQYDSTKLWFKERKTFVNFPITFETDFINNWNIHLKPIWKIELIDEDWKILESIWKESVSSPTWAYLWEKVVDYIPVNDIEWNILPNTNRLFSNVWKWFGYTILNNDWTKSVKFKSLEEYYSDKTAEKQTYLMFWQSIHTRKVTKTIKANLSLSYKWKDLNEKKFNKASLFFITYNEKYVWLNYIMISIISILVLMIIIYFIKIAPKNKSKKEEEMRKKILEEMEEKK